MARYYRWKQNPKNKNVVDWMEINSFKRLF